MSDKAPDKDLFNRITNEEEKNKIFQNLIHNKVKIQAKAIPPDSELCVIQVTSLMKNQLVCQIVQPSSCTNLKNQPFVMQFLSGADKYIYQAHCVIDSKSHSLSFDLKNDLFQIQRRDDFRLHFPKYYKATFQIKRINSKTLESATNLLDISTGGCRFESPTQLKFKIGDHVEGEINLANRAPIAAGGEVKHLMPHPDNFEIEFIGLQFSNLVTISQNKIFAVVMDIYRELFSKFN